MSQFEANSFAELCLISNPSLILSSKNVNSQDNDSLSLGQENEKIFNQKLVDHFKKKIENISDLIDKLNNKQGPKKKIPKIRTVRIKQELSNKSEYGDGDAFQETQKVKGKYKDDSYASSHTSSSESDVSDYTPMDTVISESESETFDEPDIPEVVAGCGPVIESNSEPEEPIESDTSSSSVDFESIEVVQTLSRPRRNVHSIGTPGKPKCAKLALITMLELQKLAYQKAILFYMLKHNATKDMESTVLLEVKEPIPPPHTIQLVYKPKKIVKRTPPVDVVENATKLSDGKYKCNFCEKILSVRGIVAHINGVHTKVTEYPCKVCGKIFLHEQTSKNHLLTHSELKNFPCLYCDKIYKRKHILQKHVDTVHKNIKKYTCTKCPKRFMSKEKLNAHLGSKHDGAKPFQCDRCGKSYSQKVSLDYHIKTHDSNSKPFACKVCGKSYTSKYTMLNHLHTHSQSNGFLCAECGKCFPIKSHLLKHKCKTELK